MIRGLKEHVSDSVLPGIVDGGNHCMFILWCQSRKISDSGVICNFNVIKPIQCNKNITNKWWLNYSSHRMSKRLFLAGWAVKVIKYNFLVTKDGFVIECWFSLLNTNRSFCYFCEHTCFIPENGLNILFYLCFSV